MSLSSLWRALTRRKVVDLKPSNPVASTSGEAGGADAAGSSESSSPLARVLTTFDLTALGVGSTLGVGVYVLAGSVARDFAGPAVIISFFVAAVASIFAGLCYAEFGARVPLAGSAYIYSYVSIGEFMAFVIGWNLIMEYVIGCASVARGLSNYLDQLMDNVMQESFQNLVHLHVDFLSPYIDFFAFGISFLLSVVLAFGVKESMSLNNVFTTINMAVVLFVIVAGAFKADIANWQIDPATVTTTARVGKGGFFPFGVMGVLRGAATCFYGFIGFDCVATTGEEVKNPQRAIPIAIIVSLVIIFLSYFGVSAVLTLMWPYYLQDPDAPLPYVFQSINWPAAQWTVAIGGIFGLFASLFGAMYPLPRVIYAMANDGLIFKFLGEVHPKYKTPVVGTLLAGVITGVMAALFKLQQLVNMLSIGTLVAYTMVAACVLLLRYRNDVVCEPADEQDEEAVSLLSDSEKYRSSESDEVGGTEFKETTNLVSLKEKPTFSKLLLQVFNSRGLRSPTAVTSQLVGILVLTFCGLSVALGLCLVNYESELMYGHWGPLALVCVISSLLLIVVLSIALQPSSSRELPFKVPFVPVIPALSILLNIYLILMLDIYTWIRFIIWMAVGVGVYFLSLACRTLRWCGSPPVFHSPSAQPRMTLAASVNPVSSEVLNGHLDPKISLNGSNAMIWPGEVYSSEVTEICEKETNTDLPADSLDTGINSSNKVQEMNIIFPNGSAASEQNMGIQCATPIIHGDAISRGVSQEEKRVFECVRAEGFLNDGFIEDTDQNCDTREWSQKNDSTCSDDDDVPSITEVTNDLLSLTYENQDRPLPLIFIESTEQTGVENSSELRMNAFEIKDVTETASCVYDPISANLDSDTEDDVRSLYPDVVVISSSEEDIQSRSSIISSLVNEEGEPLDSISNTEGDISANWGDCVSEPIVNDMECVEENKNEENVKADNTSFPLSLSNETDQESIESPDECEASSPLKNASFVEKLEKIIGAQSMKIRPLSHRPIRKSISMADMETVHPGLDRSVSPELGNSPKQVESKTEELVKEHNFMKEGGEHVHVKDSRVDNEESEDVFEAVGDIRAKLERIFSVGGSSPVVSPISKVKPVELPVFNSHQVGKKPFPAKETYEGHLISRSLSVDSTLDGVESSPTKASDHAKDMDETRRRMVNVLGTLRLRNRDQSEN